MPLLPTPARVAVVGFTASLLVSLVAIARPSYWYDEAATIASVDRPWRQLLDLVRDVDLVHLAYYVVVKPWIDGLGVSEFATRFPSAVALAVAAAGFALLVQRRSGRRTAVIAVVGFALLPGIAWAGTEARSYAFVVAAVVWAVYALTRAGHGDGRGWWAAFVVLAVSSTLLHLMAVLMLPVYLVLTWRDGRSRDGLVAVVVAGLVVAPYLYLAQTQSGQVGWISVDALGLARSIVLGQLFLGPRGATTIVMSAVALGLALFFLVAGLAALRADGVRGDAVVALSWFAVPTLLLGATVGVGQDFYTERYLAFAAPGAVWLAAQGVASWRLGARSAAGVAVVFVALVAVPLIEQRGQASKGDEDYRALASLARGADAALFSMPDARGVAVTHPEDFAGVRDLLLSAGPSASNTIWGHNARIGSVAPRGRVVAYVGTTMYGRQRAAVEVLVAREGCRREREVVRHRWTGWLLDCG